MSGLKPILKLGVPVRARPQRRRACAPCVARPGQPSSPKHLALFAAHSPEPGVHAHEPTHAPASPRRAHRWFELAPTSALHPADGPCTPRASRSTHSRAAPHPPPPTSCRRRGGASPSAPSASSSCMRSYRSSSCRRSTACGRAGARQHGTADTLVDDPQPLPTPCQPHRPTPILAPPPRPNTGPCASPPRAAPASLHPAPLLPLHSPPTPSYALLPPPTPSDPSTPSRRICAGLAWRRSLA
jgi:hypothetical protein